MGFQQNMEVLTFRGYVYSLNIKQKWKKLFCVLAQLKFSVFQWEQHIITICDYL